MSNKEWFSPVGNTCSSVQTGYEGCRAQVAQTVKGWCGPEAGKGKLIEKVSKSVSEILIDLSALTGILVLPASLFFAAKRVVPLLSLLKEYFRKGSTKESVSIQWKEIKAGYRKTFEEKHGSSTDGCAWSRRCFLYCCWRIISQSFLPFTWSCAFRVCLVLYVSQADGAEPKRTRSTSPYYASTTATGSASPRSSFSASSSSSGSRST